MNSIYDLAEKLNQEMQNFDLEHERVMIQMRIMSEIERIINNKNISYKKLAELTGFSASYITQLFKGHKKLNLETVAKFQNVLNLKFNIKFDDKTNENEDFLQAEYHKMIVLRNNVSKVKEFKQIAV